MPLVEQELLTFRNPPLFSMGFLLLNRYFSLHNFVDHCLPVCPLSVCHCIFCPSMYGFFDIFKMHCIINRCTNLQGVVLSNGDNVIYSYPQRFLWRRRNYLYLYDFIITSFNIVLPPLVTFALT